MHNRPFEFENPREVIRRHAIEDLDPPLQAPPGIEGPVDPHLRGSQHEAPSMLEQRRRQFEQEVLGHLVLPVVDQVPEIAPVAGSLRSGRVHGAAVQFDVPTGLEDPRRGTLHKIHRRIAVPRSMQAQAFRHEQGPVGQGHDHLGPGVVGPLQPAKSLPMLEVARNPDALVHRGSIHADLPPARPLPGPSLVDGFQGPTPVFAVRRPQGVGRRAEGGFHGSPPVDPDDSLRIRQDHLIALPQDHLAGGWGRGLPWRAQDGQGSQHEGDHRTHGRPPRSKAQCGGSHPSLQLPLPRGSMTKPVARSHS